jgi:hypothetical protein
MTTIERLPGLVGDVFEYLCGLPGMDIGLAQGAALSVVAGVATGDRYFVPALGIRDDVAALGSNGTILFGADAACRVAIREADAILDSAVGDRSWTEPPWTSGTRVLSRRKTSSHLSMWTGGERPAWFPQPDSNVYCPLLVAATGTAQKVTRLPPYTPPGGLLGGLRDIADNDGPTLVRMTPAAAEGFHLVTCDLFKNVDRYGDPSLRLGRWMFLLGVMAIGVNPRNPEITEDMLTFTAGLASNDHSLLMWTLEPAPASTSLVH